MLLAPRNLATTASFSEKLQTLAVGYDPGFGQTKLILSGHSPIIIPSYYLETSYTLTHNIPESINGGFVRYVNGSRQDLKERSWLGGYPAYLHSPGRYEKSADDRKGKAVYGLQLLLSALSVLPHRDVWNLFIVASVHDVETYGAKLQQALEGVHVVQLGSQQKLVTINIQVGHIYEEGYGVCAARLSATRQPCQRLLYDLGSRTIRVVSFGHTGNVVGQPETISEGVDSLIDAIAKHPTVRALEDGQEGDRHLIRVGIEQQTLTYGKQNPWSFAEVYREELGKWAKAVLLRALKAGLPYQKNADEVIACGGGSQLPSILGTLKSNGIIPITDSVLANAQGLKQLADLMLTRSEGLK